MISVANKPGKSIEKKSNKYTRSKSGCYQCKSKKVKCDESKPKCSRCDYFNLSCDYNLRLQFREDLIKIGKSFGREGVWSKKKQPHDSSFELSNKSKNNHFQPILNHQLQFINHFYSDLYPHPSRCLNASIIPVDIKNSVHHDISHLSFALNYYVSFISPILNPIGTYSPNFSHSTIYMDQGLDINIVVQYTQQKPGLFYLMVALGCIYLSNLNDSDQEVWLQNAYYYRNLGVHFFSSQLTILMNQDGSKKPIDFEVDMLLGLVKLVMFDIADHCNTRWSDYLLAGKDLISVDRIQLPRNTIELTLLKFSLEYLNYQELVGRTVCICPSNDFLKLLEDPSFHHQPDEVREYSWIGCDNAVLQTISEITDLSIVHKKKTFDQSYFQEKAAPLITFLESLRTVDIDYDYLLAETPTDSSGSYSPDLLACFHTLPEDSYLLELTNEIRRLSTLLYLDCAILNATPDDTKTKRLVRTVLYMLEFVVIKNDFKWCNTLLWSAFMASVEISPIDPDSERLRYLSLQIFDKLQSFTLGNVPAVKEVLQNVWKKRDIHTTLLSVIKSIKLSKESSRVTNDWEFFVVDEELSISLA